jgi:peptide-methionine (S)-S-oxide reductase
MARGKSHFEIAIFGGGCFWCTEAVFKMLRGVVSVLAGYSGGLAINPTYDEVSGGLTGHAEVTRVEFNPAEISFRDLLAVFFGSHDPTTKNRQANDLGPQYRSVIFYTTDKQKNEAARFIARLNGSNRNGLPIVTELEPFPSFTRRKIIIAIISTAIPRIPIALLLLIRSLRRFKKTLPIF